MISGTSVGNTLGLSKSMFDITLGLVWYGSKHNYLCFMDHRSNISHPWYITSTDIFLPNISFEIQIYNTRACYELGNAIFSGSGAVGTCTWGRDCRRTKTIAHCSPPVAKPPEMVQR